MEIIGSILKTAIDLRSKPRKELTVENAIKIQKKVLKKLLRKAQITAIGEEFNFSEILKQKELIKAFQKSVPIYDYNSIFKKWWYRCLNGETFVSWPGKINYFALSSGTSEASSKYIPISNDIYKAIKKTSIRQLFSLARYDFPPEFYNKGFLAIGGSTHLQYNGTYYEGDLSGITTSNIPFWFQHFYKPGKRIAKERDWSTKLEEIIKNAPNWDIGVIVGVPAWLQILLSRIIERYNLKTIHDIWPNLSMYLHGGVSFAPYQKSFEKLLARPLIYVETYLASEGFIAYQNRPKSTSMQMVVDNGLFFEFVPFNDENFDTEGNIISSPTALTIDEVEENKEYALLLTTCAGAWRYIIGDTIKFTDKKHCEIVITGRTKHYLNLCGEHLSQENMNMAIKKLEEQLNCDVREFTVAGIKHENMFAHKWFLGTDDNIDPETAKILIDQNLMVLNDDYRVERIAAIKDLKVVIVPLKAFYDWMKLKGKEGGQNKFPRVIKSNRLADWETFIQNYK